MNCVGYLCFGCENDDINLIKHIAHIILKEDDVYSSNLQTYLKNGLSFAASREKAIIKSLVLSGVTASSEEISTLLKSPNSILAIEYIKAIQKSGSKIVPVPVKREDHGYHSLKLSSGFASSSAIRNMYQKPSVYNFNNITCCLIHHLI